MTVAVMENTKISWLGEFPTHWKVLRIKNIFQEMVRASYNFAQYLPERKEMMQWWSNYIQGLTNEW